MKIDRASPVPIYKQLAEIFRRQIEIQELLPVEPFPTEEKLIQTYQISRITIRKALKLLVDEGLIVRQSGKGTFISQKKIEEPIESLQGFAELMKQEYPEQYMLVDKFEQIPATRKIAHNLNVEINQSVQYIKRFHLIESKPIAYVEIFLPVEVGSLMTADEVSTTPIYKILDHKTDIKIWRAMQTIRAISADQEIATLLQISNNSPILFIERITYSVQDQPIEYIQLYYPGSRHELVMELFRNPSQNVLRPARNEIHQTQ